VGDGDDEICRRGYAFLVTPNPPVRRFAGVVRAVVKTMELASFGGNDLIARTLARAG
jgi:hypothetical protein